MRTDRIVALIDMDCFYVQVHQREEPETWGTPCAVVQYTGGGVIAVNYEAREFGVRRGNRVPDCKAKCPPIRLFHVPEQRGKADLTMYRKASAEVFSVLLNFDSRLVVERASIDEAYLDLTEITTQSDESSYSEVSIAGSSVAGTGKTMDQLYQQILEEDDRLLTAAKIIQKIRTQVKEATNFTCTAGISYNKVLAKLCAGFKKPNGQSVLPASSLDAVFETTPIEKVRGLGGKLGLELKQQFGIETMLQLQRMPKEILEAGLGSKRANWVSELANGNDDEPVNSRSVNKSVGCGKNFQGLTKVDDLKHWFNQLTGELVERLTDDREMNERTATNVVVNVRLSGVDSFSKTVPLKEYRQTVIIEEMERALLPRLAKDQSELSHPILSLNIAAGRFVDGKSSSSADKTPLISSFFASNDSSTVSPLICSTSVDADQGNVSQKSSDASSSLREVRGNTSKSSNKSMSTSDANLSPSFSDRGFFYRKTVQLIRQGEM